MKLFEFEIVVFEHSILIFSDLLREFNVSVPKINGINFRYKQKKFKQSFSNLQSLRNSKTYRVSRLERIQLLLIFHH